LLALQAVDDPVLGRKKAIRRGTALLDTLEQIKADLLIGRVSEGRLNQLMVLIGQARDRNLPGLDGVLDDIELRARVELAKFGRYPAA
ncbi:MAG TPA: flagellar assembly protein FliX, partial [Devosia sp.]|nr:flagellar assembly protein FliX [Devosia sp.]